MVGCERSLGDSAVSYHSLVKAPGFTPHPRRTIPRQVFFSKTNAVKERGGGGSHIFVGNM